MIETEKYKNHSIMIRNGNYSIFWIRGKEFFDFEVSEELAVKSRKSDKDALEVMFYLENKRWPKEGELENYNKTLLLMHLYLIFLTSLPNFVLHQNQKNLFL